MILLHISLRSLKLRHQLLILIITSIVVLVLFQAFYLYRFYVHAQQRSEISTQNILSQVEEYLKNITVDIKNTSTTLSYSQYTQNYLNPYSPVERWVNSKFIREMIDYVKASNKGIKDILILDTDGTMLNSSSTDLYPIVDEVRQIYDLTNRKVTEPKFISLKSSEQRYNFYLYVSPFTFVDNSGSTDKAGTCIILCDRNYIQNMINSIVLTQNSLLLITDSDKYVVAANKQAIAVKQVDPELLNAFPGDLNTTIQNYKGKKSIFQRNKIIFMNWEVVSVIPVNEITADLQSTIQMGMYISIGLLIILSAAGYIFSRNITRPISNLIQFMNLSVETNLHKRIENIEQNEVGQLAVHVNSMLDKIHDMTRRIVSTQSSLYEMELAKKQAEILALQSQINPHFLYNTLDCIRSIAYCNNVMEIVAISTAMAKIFRYSIKGGDVVKVQNEIESIKDYLEIMCIRYPDKFDIQLDIADEILNLNIAKFILQPIVENAIYYGLEQKNRRGLLRITGKLIENGNLFFEVYDNGKGISKEVMDNINRTLTETPTVNNNNKSIGISNIHNRLKFAYGEKYGLRIFSKENEGTTVLIEIPKMYIDL